MAKSGKTSPWVYVAVGCGVAILLAIVVVAGLGFAGWRWARRLESDIKDPASREARVLEVLGAERIPEGYYPVIGMEIPFFMEMAILSDVPPREGDDEPPDGFDERGFLYFKMISSGRDRRKLEDFLEGREQDADFLRRSSINLSRGEVVSRGTLTLPGAEQARYVAQRGSIAMGRGGRGEGLTATALVECSGDSRMRLAMWFGPDPDPAAEAASLDLSGTVADAEALGEFLGQFRFCGRSSPVEAP